MTFACTVVGVIILQATFCTDAQVYKSLCNPDTGGLLCSRQIQDAPLDTPMYLKEEKWYTFFKMFDLDHNIVLNEDDVNIQWNVLKSIYNMEDIEADRVKKQLLAFWKCLFHGLKIGLSKKDLMANLAASKGLKVNRISKCLDIYVDAIDHNNDGYISLLEFDAHLKSFNLGNEILVQKRFETICGEPVLRCPLEKFSDAWTELFTGENTNKYELIKKNYEDAGMPLNKLVE